MASGSSSWAQMQFSQSQVGVARVVRQTPRETSTVVPGQLPMVTREPVRALNSVDLPVLGAPTSATTGASVPAVCWGLVSQQALAEDGVAVVGVSRRRVDSVIRPPVRASVVRGPC